MKDITIRNETYKLLGLSKNPQFLKHLNDAIRDFCEYNFKDASFAIFNLLHYSNDPDLRDKALNKFGFTTSSEKSFKYEYDFLTEEMATAIAEELQYQYMTHHPGYLQVPDYPGCEKELKSITALLKDKPLLLFRAVESAYAVSKWDSDKSLSIVKQLLSSREEHQLMGLASLGHNSIHQKLLLPYVTEIAFLLRAMQNEHLKQQRIAAAQEELKKAASPWAPLAKLEPKKEEPIAVVPADSRLNDEKPVHEQTESPAEECVTERKPVKSSYIKEYTIPDELAKLLDNKAELTFSLPGAEEFWELLKKLRSMGIDLNLLVEHLDQLPAIVAAHDDLEKATDSLLQAEKEFDMARDNFLKEDLQTLHTFVAASKALQDAKKLYDSTFDGFVKLCEEY